MEVRVAPESQEKNRIAKTLTAALYEAGVKIDQITLLLQKYVDVDYHTARNYIVMERLMDGPCRRLEEYLIMERGFSEEDTYDFVHKKAERALGQNPDLAKLKADKLYAELEKSESHGLTRGADYYRHKTTKGNGN